MLRKTRTCFVIALSAFLSRELASTWLHCQPILLVPMLVHSAPWLLFGAYLAGHVLV